MSRASDATAAAIAESLAPSGICLETPAVETITTCARCSGYRRVHVTLAAGGIWAGARFGVRLALCAGCAGELGDRLSGRRYGGGAKRQRAEARPKPATSRKVARKRTKARKRRR